MFTGIIEKIGKVYSIDRKGDSSVIGLQINEADYSLGDSVCINGVCLTVEKIHQNIYSFSISPETNNLTNLNHLENEKEQAILLNQLFACKESIITPYGKKIYVSFEDNYIKKQFI